MSIRDQFSHRISVPNWRWLTRRARPETTPDSYRLRPRRRPADPAGSIPETVTFWGDPVVRHLVARAPAGKLLVGLGAHLRPVFVDLDGPDPHIGIVSGAGGGTTTLLRTLTAQALRQGAEATIIDPIHHEFRWAAGLGGVTYAATFDEAERALIAAGETLHRRAQALDATGQLPERHHLVVLAPSLPTVAAKLRRRWRNEHDRARSPALEALDDLLQLGRAERMHVLFGQGGAPVAGGWLSLDITPGRALIGRATQNVWDVLAPHLSAEQRRPGVGPVGRFHLIGDVDATGVQALHMTPLTARALAEGANPESPKET